MHYFSKFICPRYQKIFSTVLKIYAVQQNDITRLDWGDFDHCFFFSFFPLPPVDWQPTHYLSKLARPISKNLFHCVIDVHRPTKWYHQTRLDTFWPLFFFLLFLSASCRDNLPYIKKPFPLATKWYHQTRLGRFWPLFFSPFFSSASCRLVTYALSFKVNLPYWLKQLFPLCERFIPSYEMISPD